MKEINQIIDTHYDEYINKYQKLKIKYQKLKETAKSCFNSLLKELETFELSVEVNNKLEIVINGSTEDVKGLYEVLKKYERYLEGFDCIFLIQKKNGLKTYMINYDDLIDFDKIFITSFLDVIK